MSTVAKGDSASLAVKNSAVISFFNGLGAISVLAFDMLIAASFGLSQRTDAFFIAYTIPRIFVTVLMVATDKILIPIFTGILLESGRNKLWEVASNLVSSTLLLLGGIATLSSILSPVMIRLLGAGLDEPTRELAVSLTQIVFFMIVPASASEILKSLLNALRSFALPAAAKVVLNGVAILAVAIYRNTLDIYAVALAYVVASCVELAFLALVLFMKGFRYRFIVRWRDPYLLEVARQLRWPLLGGLLNQGGLVIERFLASFLPTGLVSAIVYARRVFSAVDSILLRSVSTAFLPRLTAQFAQKDMENFKKSLVLSLRLATFVAIPITLILIVLSRPVIELLFQRGSFDAATTDITARLFSIYLLAFLPTALWTIFISTLYAMYDAKTPFKMLVVSLVSSLVFYVILFFSLGATGLALTLPLSRLVVAILLGIALHRRIGAVDFRPLYILTAKVSIASLGMGALVYILQNLDVATFKQSGILEHAGWLAIMSIAGGITFVVLLLVLRVRETNQIIGLVKLRLARRFQQ